MCYLVLSGEDKDGTWKECTWGPGGGVLTGTSILTIKADLYISNRQ